MTAEIIPFGTEMAERASDEPALVVDVEGFEGPLDLLLTLARQQKVDLAKISILALADQYLAYIEAARTLRLELAADYLVMAAWLAYLKSRLLLPDLNPAEGPERRGPCDRARLPPEAAGSLPGGGAEADGHAAARSRSVQPRRSGADHAISSIRNGPRPSTICSRPMRCSARKPSLGQVRFKPRTVWTLADARTQIERLIGATDDWSRLDQFLIAYLVEPSMTATVTASSFASALELVREGVIELQQHAAFAPLYIRKRAGSGAAEPGTTKH